MNSSDINNIKQIVEVKVTKKKVKISCENRNVGKEIAKSIENNKSTLTSNGYEDLKKGFGYKDFTYHFGSKEEAIYFGDRLADVKSGRIGPDPVAGSDGGMSGYEAATETENGSGKTLIIAACLIVVVAMGVMLWPKK